MFLINRSGASTKFTYVRQVRIVECCGNQLMLGNEVCLYVLQILALNVDTGDLSSVLVVVMHWFVYNNTLKRI